MMHYQFHLWLRVNCLIPGNKGYGITLHYYRKIAISIIWNAFAQDAPIQEEGCERFVGFPHSFSVSVSVKILVELAIEYINQRIGIAEMVLI